jgi:AraC-type DNA-binding domain-containing proteins
MILNNLYNSRHKTLNRFLASYLILSVIIIIISGTLYYFQSMSDIQKNNSTFYKNFLAKTKRAVESKLFYINDLSITLLQNYRFNQFLTDPSYLQFDEPTSNLEFFYMKSSLKEICYLNNGIKDAAFYLSSKQQIINCYGINNSLQFLNRVYQSKYTRFEDYLNEFSKWNDIYYKYTSNAILNDRNINMLTFARTVSINHSSIDGSVMLFVDRYYFTNALPLPQSPGDPYPFIIDETGNIIAGLIPSGTKDINLSGYNYKNNIIKATDNKRYQLLWDQLDDIPWKLCIYVPVDSSFPVRYLVISYIIISIIFIIVITIIFSFLAFKNYRPVKELISLIEDMKFENQITKSSQKRGSYDDEYHTIEKSILTSYDNLNLLKNRLGNLLNLLNECCINRLLTGNYSKAFNIRYIKDTLRLVENSADFMVLAFRIDVLYSHINLSTEINDKIAINFFESLGNEIDKSSTISYMITRYGCSSNNIILINRIYSSKGSRSELLNNGNLQELIDKVRMNIERMENSLITIGIGSPVESLEHIQKSYLEASESLMLGLMLGKSGISKYKPINEQDSLCFYFPVEIELELLNAIKARDIKKIKNTVTYILAENQKNGTQDALSVKSLFYELYATFIKGIKILNQKNYNINLEGMGSIESISDLLVFIENALTNNIGEIDTNDRVDIYSLTQRFIDENCYHPGLTINFIAEQLKLPTYTISSCFQSEAGLSITDYVNTKRISYAVDLLKKTSYPISVITKMTGFSNEHTFIKVFNRYNGISPGQYRNLYLSK